MKNRTRHCLAGAALGVAIALVATGCGASPYAAKVNSQVISQDSLNNELTSVSANQAAVSYYRQGGLPVRGAGVGTYNSAWVAYILQDMIVLGLVHQDLSRRHDLPGPAELPAAWAVATVDNAQLWPDYSRSYQATLAERQAELINLAPGSQPQSVLRSVYRQYQSVFYSAVCVTQIAISRDGANGSVSSSASLAAASRDESLINSGQSTKAIAATPASLGCLTPSALEQYPAAEQTVIKSLAVGHASDPYPATYGYYLLEVTSRRVLPFSDPSTQAALQYLAEQIIGSQRQSETPTQKVEISLAEAARVKINPAYGTWHTSEATNAAGLGLAAPLSPKVP